MSIFSLFLFAQLILPYPGLARLGGDELQAAGIVGHHPVSLRIDHHAIAHENVPGGACGFL